LFESQDGWYVGWFSPLYMIFHPVTFSTTHRFSTLELEPKSHAVFFMGINAAYLLIRTNFPLRAHGNLSSEVNSILADYHSITGRMDIVVL
jgi:hypothetical protein